MIDWSVEDDGESRTEGGCACSREAGDDDLRSGGRGWNREGGAHVGGATALPRDSCGGMTERAVALLPKMVNRGPKAVVAAVVVGR